MIATLPQLAPLYFDFVESSYGFRRVLSTETTVRWETDRVFVQIQYDATRSFEVGLEIGQITIAALRLVPPYSLREMVGVGGVAFADRPFFQASTEERLKAALEKIARLLLQHGNKLLADDAEAFKSIARQREEDCALYASRHTPRGRKGKP